MHKSAYDIISRFVKDYVKDNDIVLDVGSCDVNGSIRDLFNNCKYIGIDVVEGPNVDIILHDPYHWSEIKTSSVDVVICSSVIEHTTQPWEVFKEIQRVLKPNGCFCIIAPAIWEVHRYPVDCFRFLPDGMKALCELACLEVEVVEMTEAYDKDILYGWQDCYCIGLNLYNS